MMNLRVIVLFATFALVNANQLTSYNIKNIVCENLEHKYDEYYRAPCKIWKDEMSKRNPKNMIQCIAHTARQSRGCRCGPSRAPLPVTPFAPNKNTIPFLQPPSIFLFDSYGNKDSLRRESLFLR